MLGMLLLIMPWFTNPPEEREMTERMVPRPRSKGIIGAQMQRKHERKAICRRYP